MRSVARAAGAFAVLGALCAAPGPRERGEEAAAPAPPEEGAAAEESLRPPSPEFLEMLARVAVRYREYALRLTCIETVRAAKYGASGEAEKETVRRYAYLLYRDADGKTLRELRQRVREDGTITREEVRDEEPFPPAYAWVDLFSRSFQPFFAYRDRGERFEGYEWVREIEFRGALPFSDGKDIREWEGTVLVNAISGTPVEIRAEPSGQGARVRLLYERWSSSFRLLGLRVGPRPIGYRCRVAFRTHRDGLSFPTELRYDTFRAVSAVETVPTSASIRSYDAYRFFRVEEQERLVEVAPP